MLHKRCHFATSSLADEFISDECEFMDVELASKMVDAMFNLQEVECTVKDGLIDDSEIATRGSLGVVRTLLIAAHGIGSDFDYKAEQYANFLVSVCNANSRLRFAFYLYHLMATADPMEFVWCDYTMQILNHICKKLNVKLT